MKRHDYLRLALKNRCYEYKEWIVKAFTFVRGDVTNALPIPFNIVQTPEGFYFKSENDELVRIEDAPVGIPLFSVSDMIDIDPEICPNVTEKRKAHLGNTLLNLICLVSSFGSKIKYIDKFTVGKVEKEVALRLKDLPEDLSQKTAEDLYPDELNLFNDSLEYLKALDQVFSQVNSEKTITPPPNIDETRTALAKKYGDKLKDPVELASFEAELKAIDNDYLKDDPASKFVNGKMKNVSRKRLYLSFGYETGFNETGEMRPVLKSLSEGWELNALPDMVNNLRLGSYGRGAETQLGGEMTKWLLRTLNGVKVKSDDCGTRLGMRVFVTEENYNRLINLYIVGQSKPILITDADVAKKLIGKYVVVRQPQFCQQGDGLNYCKTCLGKTLGDNPRIIPSAGATYGSTLMMVSMKKMHGVALETEPLDLDTYLT